MGREEKIAEKLVPKKSKEFNPQNKLREIQQKLKGRWYLDTFIEKVIFLTGGLAIFLLFIWIITLIF